MKKFLSAAIVFLLIFPALSSAMNGMEIYNKYSENEKKREKKIKNAIFEYETQSESMIIHGKMYFKGDKTRIESTVIETQNEMLMKKGSKTIMIDDGKSVSTITSDGQCHTYPNDNEEQDEEMSPPSVKLIGKEKVSGIECYRIETDYGFGDKSEMWISVNDFNLVKESMENGSSIELNSDFRKISGISIPFKSQSLEDGKVIQTNILKSVKLDVNTDDSLYDPSKVKGYKKPSDQDRKNMMHMNKMDQVMELGNQINYYYENGEPEKAKELEKKLQMLMESDN
ncbi:MAG: hypothetical protein H6681_06245 [Desulfobacteraceae bacterium]|nr:hypothetical protein [Desulfobacteraceae bacterium]MCB9495026.1 hypothetical protein [Desulfobacteraceae bacterium]